MRKIITMTLLTLGLTGRVSRSPTRTSTGVATRFAIIARCARVQPTATTASVRRCATSATTTGAATAGGLAGGGGITRSWIWAPGYYVRIRL